MTMITKVQTLSSNLQGKSVGKNSFVKFKTWNQNHSTAVNHAGNLNENPFSEDLTRILLQLKNGDKVQLLVKNKEKEEKMILELIEVQDGQEFKQTYQRAQAFKNKGNDSVKVKNYEQAAKSYQQGLQLVEYDCTPESQPVKISLLSNLTLAYLNTKKYQQCLKTCDQYLSSSMQPNKKIVYRKASANKNLRKWAQAQNDIKFGLQICQNDEQGRKYFEALSEAIKKEKKIQAQKEKKVYSKIFG